MSPLLEVQALDERRGLHCLTGLAGKSTVGIAPSQKPRIVE